MFLPHQLNLDKRARFKFDGVIKHCESVGPGDKREINIDTSTSPDRFTKAIFISSLNVIACVVLTAGILN